MSRKRQVDILVKANTSRRHRLTAHGLTANTQSPTFVPVAPVT